MSNGPETPQHDDDVRDLMGAYALNALNDAERAEVEAYLAENDDAAREVQGLVDAAAQYGAAHSVTPPEWMRQAVLDRITESGPVASSQQAAPAPTSARARAQRRWFGWVSGAVAAAATVVAIVLGVSLSQTQSELEAVRADQAYVAEVSAQPDAELVPLDAEDGHGNVVVSRSADAAAFIAGGMDKVSEEETYQLWVIGDEVRSAGTFDVGADGSTGVLAAEGVDDAAALGVTVEPAGGSEQPTMDPIMLAELPS